MTAATPISYVSKAVVAERLPQIFPEGTTNRNYCVRDLAASTVFTMLYIGAIEGSEIFLAPKHVYRMTDEQAARFDNSARKAYASDVLRTNHQVPGIRWYQDTTREPIRDETLREGLVAIGAVLTKANLPTTSSKPRYALKSDFARLFDPALKGSELDSAIQAWQHKNLTASARARLSLARHGAGAEKSSIKVRFPNGETRLLEPGPSSVIAQSVIEHFSFYFLTDPAVLWLSESGNKVIAQNGKLANQIGLKIEPDKNLPDIILVDLGPADPLIVFVEVVATDGAVTSRRQSSLISLTEAAGFKRSQVAFVTAYKDRASIGFKKTVSDLAWGTFAWFATEPTQIIVLRDGASTPAKILDLLK